MSCGLIGYVVPNSLFPAGYHGDPSKPLPFLTITSQQHFIGLYHMGLYTCPWLMDWFRDEYARRIATELDMDKACVRFEKPDRIPFSLISRLCSKLSPEAWITTYLASLEKR